MMNMIKIVIGLAILVSLPAMAQLSHVSINQRLFELGEHPRLRVNIVASATELSRLEFSVRQGTSEEKLMVKRMNGFMLLLSGVEEVRDVHARLLVKAYKRSRWQLVRELPLFGAGQPGLTLQLAEPSVPGPLPVEEASVTLPASSAGECKLAIRQGETLWRIASRYGKKMATNTYAALLAIFESNPDAFYQGKINGLKRGASLTCPPSAILDKYADPVLAKHKFESL